MYFHFHVGKLVPINVWKWKSISDVACSNILPKMEFQGRGAGHIHGVACCDLRKVSELIKEEKKNGVILQKEREEDVSSEDGISSLENAFRSLRGHIPLTEDEEKVLIDFVDRSVTCTLSPDLAAKMIDVKNDKDYGKKIIQIVKECLNHHHTKACNKQGGTGTCRFRFPKFPLWEK